MYTMVPTYGKNLRRMAYKLWVEIVQNVVLGCVLLNTMSYLAFMQKDGGWVSRRL